MLHRLVLHQEYAQRLGKTRLTLRFLPGINLLVGPNGSGKSTVIDCLEREVLCKEKKDEWGGVLKDQKRHATWYLFKGGEGLHILSFDFEKGNPRVGTSGPLADMASIQRVFMRQKYSIKSHGEFTRDVIQDLDKKRVEHKGRMFLVMDEPEQALDLEGLRKLHRILTATEDAVAQAIIATHHPFLMADPAFNIIDMDPGYHESIMQALRDVARQL